MSKQYFISYNNIIKFLILELKILNLNSTIIQTNFD